MRVSDGFSLLDHGVPIIGDTDRLFIVGEHDGVPIMDAFNELLLIRAPVGFTKLHIKKNAFLGEVIMGFLLWKVLKGLGVFTAKALS